MSPLAVNNRSIGGGACGYQLGVCGWENIEVAEDVWQQIWTRASGLNNTGLLIKTCGKITHVGEGFFYIDDGSQLNDDSGHIGLKVIGALPSSVADPVGKMVSVLGISSCEKSGEDLIRVLRTRGAGDLVIVEE